jgi:Ino eighty subunit 1
VAHDHFGTLDIDFLDLFLPIKLSSPSRARAFLWLAFHYHEAPTPNPFDDDYARNHLGLIPELVPLSEEEFEKENVDPEDERNYATKMTKMRMEFLAKNAQQAGEGNNAKERKGVPKSKFRPPSPGKSIPTKRERSDPDSAVEEANDTDHIGAFSFWYFITLLYSLLAVPPSHRRRRKPLERPRAISEPSNRHSSAPHRSILERMISSIHFPHFFFHLMVSFAEAWHVVTTVDAFFDSDEEDIDEAARHAYGLLPLHPMRSYLTRLFPAMRLQVLADFHQTIASPHLPSSAAMSERHLMSPSHA